MDDIYQVFVPNGTPHGLNIYWMNDEPFFCPVRIGEILGRRNVQRILQNMDTEDEKVVLSVKNATGSEETKTFLTLWGICRLMMISRKPEAKPFRSWLLDIIVTISKTGRYDFATDIAKPKNTATTVATV